MPNPFVVERRLPGLTRRHLAAAQRALVRTSLRLSSDGSEVRYLRTT